MENPAHKTHLWQIYELNLAWVNLKAAILKELSLIIPTGLCTKRALNLLRVKAKLLADMKSLEASFGTEP